MQASVQLMPDLVEKETITSSNFTVKDSIPQHSELMDQIKAATRLGNAFRGKVYIYFEDDEGPKYVNTTIWAYGLKYICLKGGVWIPINRISEIKY